MTHASVQLMIRTDARNASIEWPRSHDARRNRNDAPVRDNVRAASIATARAFAAARATRYVLAARRGPAAPRMAAAGASSAFCARALTHGSMPCFCTSSRNDTRVRQ